MVSMLQMSLMKQNLKNTQGQQQEVVISVTFVIHSQLLTQEFPTVCLGDVQYLQCQAAEIIRQILAQCSVCALRKHYVKFASHNKGIKSFL